MVWRVMRATVSLLVGGICNQKKMTWVLCMYFTMRYLIPKLCIFYVHRKGLSKMQLCIIELNY